MAIMMELDLDGEAVEIKITARPITIGRDDSCDVTIKDPDISSHHLKIFIDDEDRTTYRDLGSKNGTYLNGNFAEEAHIYLEDVLTIGSTRMTLISRHMTSLEKAKHMSGQKQRVKKHITLGGSIKLGDVSSYKDERKKRPSTVKGVNKIMRDIKQKRQDKDREDRMKEKERLRRKK